MIIKAQEVRRITMKISAMNDNRTLLFAAEELQKYLEKISVSADVKLGLYSDFDGVVGEESDDIDSFKIDIENNTGIIAIKSEKRALRRVYISEKIRYQVDSSR